MLFEGRLGGQIYRPIGMEWAENGYWKVYDHPATQAQFLTLDQGYLPIDGTQPLNKIEKHVTNPEIYYCHDIDSDYTNKAIRLDTFFELKIDIVIATLPQHIAPFKKLCELHSNKPKLIYQIGNAWTIEAGTASNVMASARINTVPTGVNCIQYHQEFDLNIFKRSHIEESKTISSFMNVYQTFPDYQLLLEIEKQMPDWKIGIYGGQCRDGWANGTKELSKMMSNSRFIWHVKAGGDGYGHVLFNSAALGKPVIVKKSYYAGKLGEELLVDGQTCIDIDGLTVNEIIEKILYYNDSDRYFQMCISVYDNFVRVVNFDEEEKRIRVFLEGLI
jgi:hypothetical protein